MCKYYCERLCRDLIPHLGKDVISIIVGYIHHNSSVMSELIKYTQGIKMALDIYAFPTANVVSIYPDSEDFKEYQEIYDEDDEIFSGNLNTAHDPINIFYTKHRRYIKPYTYGWNIHPNNSSDLDSYGDDLDTTRDISNFEYEISMERRWSYQKNFVQS